MWLFFLFYVLYFNIFLLNLLQSILIVGVQNYIYIVKADATFSVGRLILPPPYKCINQ